MLTTLQLHNEVTKLLMLCLTQPILVETYHVWILVIVNSANRIISSLFVILLHVMTSLL